MIKTSGVFFSVLLGLGFSLPNVVSAQGASLIDKFDDWEISKSTTDAGAFEVCLATKSYKNQEAVIFYADGTSLLMGLLLERWALDARESYEVSLQFNDNPRHPGKAISGEDKKSVLINLDFFGNVTEIRGSHNLYLHTAAGSLRFDITGVDVALAGALECASQNLPSPAE
ncbi:MAG: hypothetical protein V3R64_00245 [Sphingomonadales bacterium]